MPQFGHLFYFVTQTQQITPQLALQVLLQFDKAINTALANRVRNRVNFKVSIIFTINIFTIIVRIVLPCIANLNSNDLKNLYSSVWTEVPFFLVNLKGSLNTYRFCDNVWTFVLNDVEFREVTDLVKVDKVKIVACDGKSKTVIYIC